jgi:tetrahydrodipicolinate N-succinyltransferase
MLEYDVDLKKLQSTIEHIEQSLGQGKSEVLKENADAVHALLKQLDEGTLRVCTREGDDWVTHAWINKAFSTTLR